MARVQRKQVTPWSAPVTVAVSAGAATIDLAAKDNINADVFKLTLDAGENTLTLSNAQPGRRLYLRLTINAGGSTLVITNAVTTPKIEAENSGTATNLIPLDSGKTNSMGIYIDTASSFFVDAYS